MSDLHQLEFHRHGVGLVPPPGEPETAVLLLESSAQGRTRSCTCGGNRAQTCSHVKRLSKLLLAWRKAVDAESWEEHFEGSFWQRFVKLIYEARPDACEDVRAAEIRGGKGDPFVRVLSAADEVLVDLVDPDAAARQRFLERLGKVSGKKPSPNRAGLLDRLALLQTEINEYQMDALGVKTRRQAWEESFYHRLGYHLAREIPTDEAAFRPHIDLASGDFTLHLSRGSTEIARLTVPRRRVKPTLRFLARACPEQNELALDPVPLQSIFLIESDTKLDLEVRPAIRVLQNDGEERFFARKDLEKFTYGRLVYLSELEILAELERPGKARKFKAPVDLKLRRGQVPSFLREHREAIEEGDLILDEPLQDLDIRTEYDWLELDPTTVESAEGSDGKTDGKTGALYELSVRYGFGNQSISLAEILKARKRDQSFLETADGWIDLRAPAFAHLDDYADRVHDGDVLRLTAPELLRLRSQDESKVRVIGEADRSKLLKRLVDLVPNQRFSQPEGLTSPLRNYQVIGVDWLRFLWENRLGGLLCDDMGLGKTHQAMALMLALEEEEKIDAPFLVVCPTSVLHHWRDKIRQHAPGLRASVHHGGDRDLDRALAEGSVVVTSYGILRNDLERLSEVGFALTIFDEIQNLKNRKTRGYRAAKVLASGVKLGLTGTPIENSVVELKALFDLVLPGYLGRDASFLERFALADQGSEDALRDLRRLTSPFILRRLKSSVLDELPEKFEDVRTCDLSADQVKLYRDALATRGKKILQEMEDGTTKTIPYLHVFALLSLLKQICDHPALALRQLDRADDYTSGKWDLYRELLSEALGSGQKVVVFTQYLGMIDLMHRHLDAESVDHEILTGASVKRGESVRRFNEDPDCRVFLASLKAGGTGIDLIGGSVVIHYDRWWTAAREDQATDRAHRIGQRRAVQVLKLVTEGTLEEKIAAIIDRKRDLLDQVAPEDDPRLSKIFSREELLELLRHEV